MATVTVSRSEDRLIAIKQVPSERTDEIEREAELLGRLTHRGVIELIDLHHCDDGSRALHTEFVGPDTWATRPLTDPIGRAGAGAALAAVIADLHDLGVTHRNLAGSHVIHGPGDEPVLCSFTRSRDASTEHRREDLVALAELLWDDTLTPGPVTDELARLAGATRAGQLGARELARRLDRLAADPKERSGPRADRSRFRVVLCALAVTGLVAAGVVAFTDAFEGLASGRDSTEDLGHVPEPAGPARIHSTTGSASAAKVPGSAIGSSGLIHDQGGRRYTIGRQGDLVVLGDWNCDTVATPAIVRPGTGQIAVFDQWPPPGETFSEFDASIYRIGNRPGRAEVQPGDGREASEHRCDRLLVHTATGSHLIGPDDIR